MFGGDDRGDARGALLKFLGQRAHDMLPFFRSIHHPDHIAQRLVLPPSVTLERLATPSRVYVTIFVYVPGSLG